MSAPAIEAPAVEEHQSSSAGAWLKVKVTARAVLGRVSAACSVAWAARTVLVMVLRVGVSWAVFCQRTGIAHSETITRTRLQQGERVETTRQVLADVPKLRKWHTTPWGASVRLRLCKGQDLKTFDGAMSPLRHTLRIQSAKVREVENKPGCVQLDLLRRDPLGKVRGLPAALGHTRFRLGRTEYGTGFVVDFDETPHWLFSGATGSGKSGLLLALQYAIADTDAVLVNWDLKWGLEASVMQPRSSSICTDRSSVKTTADQIVHLAEQRAQLFRAHQVRSIGEFEKTTGVPLRRVFLVVDEVAELALANTALEDEPTADEILSQVLRIVQLVRAMGIHVVRCGQRSGSDIGKKITSIRAQITGRVCLKLNDRETAQMVLPGMGDDVYSAVLGMRRPGLSVVQTSGETWHYARPPYLSYDQARDKARAEAHQVIPLDRLAAEDRE